MTDAERLRALRAASCFADWSAGDVRRLLAFFDEVVVGAGDCVAVEGAPCHQFFVVADGHLETCGRGQVGSLHAGDAWGWAAMRDRGADEATVVAVADSRLLVMGHAQFGAAESRPPRWRMPRWALPSSRRSLPRRPTLPESLELKDRGANPAC